MKLSHLQFVAAVDMLRHNRQRFCDERPSTAQLAETLERLCGHPVPVGTDAAIRDAAGVTWTSKRTRNTVDGGERFSSYNAVGTLARAVDKLYRKIGEEVPDGVAALVGHFKAKT